jgi:hypothetical protein
MESFVTSMPQLAAALSVWRPAAGVADEVLAVGVPYLKSLAQASVSWRRERGRHFQSRRAPRYSVGRDSASMVKTR